MIPSQAEYERREAREFQRQLRQAEAGSLPERQQARAEFLEAMREHPDVVAERLEWLFDGLYGFGSQQAARQLLASQGNRAARLTQVVAAVEWLCSQQMAAAAWKELSTEEKARLNQSVRRVMGRYTDRAQRGTTAHGRCEGSRTCVEHAANPGVPSCKKHGKGRRTP